jgi:hypothetical protein
MINKNWLKILVAISAIMIAGSAAYFSVTGLGVLFSGAAVAVMVMAGSLEFAKLVTATYLKQEWDNVSGVNKWYLTSAVVILMAITSAGIFGYLSNAFQQQNLKLEQVQREIDVWNNKITYTNQQIATLQGQQKDLSTTQNTLLSKGNVNSKLIKSADNRDKQSTKLSNKINSLQDSIVVYNGKINDVKNANIGIEREVGGFRFVAEAFGVELKSVVKFFIILIVVVFDPLAVALVISFNQLMLVTGKKKEEKEELEPTTNPEDLKNFVDETVRLRLSEDDLKKLEETLLNPPPPNDALKEAAEKWNGVSQEVWDRMEKIREYNESIHGPILPEDEPVGALANSEYRERGEILAEMMANDEELGLYDEPFDNPMIKNDEDQSYDVENGTEQLNEWDVTLMDGLDDEENNFHEEPTVEEENENFSTIEPISENIFQEEEYAIPVDEAVDNEPELTFEEGQLPDDMLKVLNDVQTETFSQEPTTLLEQDATTSKEEEEEKKN